MSTPSIIFLVFIVFCIGASVGSLVESALKRRSSPHPPQISTKSQVPAKNDLAGEGDVEIFGAWRKSNNNIWLEMDGKRLDNKEALLPAQRQRLLNLVLDLRPWLEMTRSAAARPGEAQQPVRSAVPEPGGAAQLVQTKKSNSALADEKKPPQPVLDSIIEQINRILQEKLTASMFRERGIQLTEGPGGIVIIKDGVNTYEGVDTVADPEVKAIIQEAVADWEKGIK
jgi:hypothetical protein